MPFSSLPPELVHQIIESTVPHTFHTTTYWEQQDTLCRLSLVSRQFRSIAQPLLFEIAFVKDDDQLNLILGDDGKVVSRQLVLTMTTGALSSNLVENSIGGAQALRSLNLHCYEGEMIDIGSLSTCKHLVNLQLSGSGFRRHSFDVLSSLQSLSLNFQTARTMKELLDPRTVPALRVLGLENIDEPYELEELRTTCIDKLLPQLDALCIELGLYRLAKDTLLLNLEPRTLVTTDEEQIQLFPEVESFSTAQHLRIDVHSHLASRGRLDAIQVVLRFLQSGQQSKPRQLRSIYLDPEFRPISADAEIVYGEFVKLEEECKEAGIDLVFEVQGRDYDWDSYISPEFCRRQTKHRERVQ